MGYQDWSNQSISLPFLDYAVKRGWNETGPGEKNVEFPVTDSCCKEYDDDSLDCGLEYDDLDKIYTTGCVKGVKQF